MKSSLIIRIAALFFLFQGALWARPVSYAGGWTLMQATNEKRHSIHLHYSPTVRDSIGYKFEYRRNNSSNINWLQYNRLLKRWNLPAAQGNTYVKQAIGTATRAGENSVAQFSALAADFETRRFFTAYEVELMNIPEFERAFSQKARIGLAPYLNSYREWASWIMIEGEHEPTNDHNMIVTPLVRFFKGGYLFEAGLSSEKQAIFNMILRF